MELPTRKEGNMSNTKEFRTFTVYSFGGSYVPARIPADWDGVSYPEFLPAPPQGMKGTAIAAGTTWRWGHENRCYTILWEDGTRSGGVMTDYDVRVDRG